jgi:hypothetical protein
VSEVLKRFLMVLLTCVVILGVVWLITIVLGVIPLPFMDVAITIAWVIGGLACLWILGRFLIDVIPNSAP